MRDGTHNALCRDCLTSWRAGAAPHPACPNCASTRVVRHPELHELAIAHIDCDAFYASVEKRDDPALRDRPVVVGGGRRGVVSAACYVARMYGVRSAMPMFKALSLCPDAAVVRPNMAKYGRVGREIRALMRQTTPLVEPLSIDEAFLDLTASDGSTADSPARRLADLVLRIEREIGVTASIGLSYNKFLAKIASDLDKPRGFAAIGRADATAFLADKPVGLIWGVGKAMRRRLAADGVETIGQLQEIDLSDLARRYGAIGARLYNFSRGRDDRKVEPEGETKSISSETTFGTDIAELERLAGELWPLCGTVARRLANQSLAARTVTLKLKTSDFRTLTRSRTLSEPTQAAEALYDTALAMLRKEADGRRFRLLGVGGSELEDAKAMTDRLDLAEPDGLRH